jgi:hydroxymethylglutaryl-CoA reductase
LKDSLILDEEEQAFLENGGAPDRCLADALIENALGFYGLPLGVVPGIVVNGRIYNVPLVTEETSVLAGLYKTALWVKTLGGSLRAECLMPQLMIGQIHLPVLKNKSAFEKFCHDARGRLIHWLQEGPAASIAARGGGVQDIELRTLRRPDGGEMGIVHVYVDVGDAMGANRVTQICEALKNRLAQETEESPAMGILSNLADRRLTTACLSLPHVPPPLARAIQEASLLAQLDPYRAATHNKGLLNGMDGVAIATGNDWRALEAGLHGFAARAGAYRGLSTWTLQAGVLEGFFQGPIQVGIRGGATRAHPGARLCLKILGVTSGQELCHVIAGVGLLQNLAALRALVSEGLTRGHMLLHVENLLLERGVPVAHRPFLKGLLKERLRARGYISQTDLEEFQLALEKKNETV